MSRCSTICANIKTFITGIPPSALLVDDAEQLDKQTIDQGSQIIAAIDVSPWTRKHTYFMIALMAALSFDYSKPATIGFTIPGMIKMWNLSKSTGSLLGIFALSGVTLGSVFWGYCADKWGRRPILLATVLLFSIASLCGATIEFYQSLIACFFMGFGVGGEGPLTFALASEYIPVRLRGKAIVILGIGGSAGGYLLAALVATIAKSIWEEEMAWRPQWLFGMLPAGLMVILRGKILPESARYLLGKRMFKAARICAEGLIGSVDKVLETYMSAHPNYVVPPFTAHISKTKDSPTVVSTLRIRTIGLSFYSFIWGLANFGYTVWIPTLLSEIGFKPWVSSLYLTFASAFALLGLPLTSWLFTHWSRKKLLVLYTVIGGTALMGQGIQDYYSITNPVFVVLVNGIAIFCLSSLGGAFPPYVSELFPTHLRGSRGGIIAGIGKFGGMAAILGGGQWLSKDLGAIWMMLFLTVTLYIAAIVLFVVGIETQGISLEKLDDEGVDEENEVDLATIVPSK